MDRDDDRRPSETGTPPVRHADAGPTAPAGEPPTGPETESSAESSAEAVAAGAAYAALGVLGLLFGLFGSFAQGWLVGAVPVAAIVLTAVNFAAVRLAAWAMRSPLGGVVFAVPWGLAVLLMSIKRSEGDLVVPGTAAGYVFILGGVVGAVIAAALQPTRRPPGEWLVRGPLSAPQAGTRPEKGPDPDAAPREMDHGHARERR
ncbi:DUF6113 family protein [Actinomadura sp. NBRC 104425]|uniref:DUF6113 family protein n=1 Tax=Actinomadura sp. NBRC 104425 TaxID=3032204 RepID=UPI0025554508|nr:DUF6113 family protein [Actinomadura sp. NBRC 104425]